MVEKKAAIYTRVSTTHQKPAMQANDCNRLIVARDFELIGYYPDVGTGAEEHRPALDELLRDARRGYFKHVVVWSLDRLARNVAHLLSVVDQLNKANVQLISVKEAFDASTPLGKAMVALLGIFAEVERELLRERILAGQKIAREKGVKFGRPRVLSEYDEHFILEFHHKGESCGKIASRLNKHRRKPVHRSTVHRFLRRQTN